MTQLEQVNGPMIDMQNQVQERDSQLEDIRSRITVIAELFEKKTIKQRYSFEVLCDFVHDKAKRLFSKYESAIKDKKAMQEEKSFYYQRKLQELEKESQDNVQTITFLKSVIIPKMAALVGKSLHGVDRLSNQFLTEIFDEVAFQFNCKEDKSQYEITNRSGNKKNINNSEMKMMVDEKHRLTNKLDEFS